MADACNLGEAVVTGPPPNSSYAYIVMVGPLGAGHRMWLLAAFAVFSALRRLGSTADFVLLAAVSEHHAPAAAAAGAAAGAGGAPRAGRAGLLEVPVDASRL